MLELRAASLADTHAIAGVIATQARSGDMIVLSGEMGAGKTAFAQGFGRALGIDEPITSPTFTLVHSYDIRAAPHTVRARTLHHADLYRLDRTVEIADLALEELAEFDGIVLVEWGDVVDAMFGDHLVVHLEYEASTDDGDEEFDPQVRRIEVSASGSSWAARWSAVVAGCEAFAC
jgi:tRNA threonylcarbamoyladenosine biosynthesis protein TsaE